MPKPTGRRGGYSGWDQRLRADRAQLLPGAPAARRRLRGGRRQRSRRRRHDGAPAQVRLRARAAGQGRQPGRRVDHDRRPRDQVPGRARSGEPALGRPRSGRRHRVDGPVHQARGRREAPGGRRQEGGHLRPGHRPRRDDRARGQRGRLRARVAPPDLERVLHHELRGPAREDPPRRVHDRAGLHDHDPRVHERPADPRPAARGPAAGPGGGDQPDSDLDRRRQGDRPGHARPQGEGGRHFDSGSRPDRVDHRPRLPPEPRDQRRGGQRGLQLAGGQGPARGDHAATRTSRSSRRTSSTRPTRASSTAS